MDSAWLCRTFGAINRRGYRGLVLAAQPWWYAAATFAREILQLTLLQGV